MLKALQFKSGSREGFNISPYDLFIFPINYTKSREGENAEIFLCTSRNYQLAHEIKVKW